MLSPTDRLTRLYAVLDDIAAEVAAWPWMDRYIELRLAHPEESPALHEAMARAECEGKAA